MRHAGEPRRGILWDWEPGRGLRCGLPLDSYSIDAMKALRFLRTAEHAAADPRGCPRVPAERRPIVMEYIAFDAHKRYTQVSIETVNGERRYEGRIDHVRGAIAQRLLLALSGVALSDMGTGRRGCCWNEG